MNTRFVGSLFAALVIAALSHQVLAAGQDGSGPLPGQDESVSGTRQATAPGGPVPRRADGKPDFSGFWQTRGDVQITNKIEEHAGGYAIRASKSWIVDPSDGKLPYQEWARKERDLRGRPENSYDDPEGHCFLSGVPRQMYVMPYQILMPKDHLVILYEYIHARRIVYFNKPHLTDNIRMWDGDSVAHWEGDALVVETTNNNGRNWLELGGDFISDAAVVTERFTMKDSNNITYRATINDPKVYTRPWTLEFPIVRITNPGMEILESACHEDNRDLPHLKAVKDAAKAKANK